MPLSTSSIDLHYVTDGSMDVGRGRIDCVSQSTQNCQRRLRITALYLCPRSPKQLFQTGCGPEESSISDRWAQLAEQS